MLLTDTFTIPLQRTLEQSVEEYMMGEINKKSVQKPWNSHSLKETSSKFISSPTPPSSVDLKIAEQLEEFHSQHTKKQEVAEIHSKSPRPCTVAVVPVLPSSAGPPGRIIEAGTFDKHFESLRSPSLEDVKESAEELDSPRKSVKGADVASRGSEFAAPEGGDEVRDAGMFGEKPLEKGDGKVGDRGEGKIEGDEKIAGEEDTTNEAKKDASIVESKFCSH